MAKKRIYFRFDGENYETARMTRSKARREPGWATDRAMARRWHEWATSDPDQGSDASLEALEALTVPALRALAAKAEIVGRSKMTKFQLIEALS